MGNTVDDNGYVVDENGDKVTTADGELVRAGTDGAVYTEHHPGLTGPGPNTKSRDSGFNHKTGKFYKK